VLALVTRHVRRPAAQPAEDGLHHEALARAVVDEIARQLGRPCRLDDFHATRTGSLIVRVGGDRDYVAKLPLQPSTEPRLRESARALQALGQMPWVTPFLYARWPTLVLTGTASDRFYSVETTVPGQDGASILKSRGRADELILSAERFLAKLQKASLDGSGAGPARWEAPFASAVERVAQLAHRAGESTCYRELVEDLKARLAAQPIGSVYSHGNFWLGNAPTGNHASARGSGSDSAGGCSRRQYSMLSRLATQCHRPLLVLLLPVSSAGGAAPVGGWRSTKMVAPNAPSSSRRAFS
jgi:hypothetical protein